MIKNETQLQLTRTTDLDYLAEHVGWYLGGEFKSITFRRDNRICVGTVTITKDGVAYYAQERGDTFVSVLSHIIIGIRSDKRSTLAWKRSRY